MTEVISFLVIVLRFIIQDFPLCYKESDVCTVISYRRNEDMQIIRQMLQCFLRLHMCLHTCCGSRQPSSMFLRGTTLIIHSQHFKGIVCGWSESNEGVGLICDGSHSLSVPPHHKPSDSISVVDPIWCRVPPGDSNRGSIAACHS